MSITDPNKSDVQSALKGIASGLAEKAAKLAEYADMMVEMSEEDFMKHLGHQYGGPGLFQQIHEQVDKAHDVRSADTYQFSRTLADVFAKAQRQGALADFGAGH